jgi:hypothetical protein
MSLVWVQPKHGQIGVLQDLVHPGARREHHVLGT